MRRVLYAVVAATILVANGASANPGPSAHKDVRAHKSHHPHKVLHAQPVKRLPVGAVSVVLHGVSYWVSNNVYYVKEGSNYVVVSAPAGRRIKHLPDGAVVVTQGGVRYYRHAGVHYKWLAAEHVYEVVKLEAPEIKPAKKYTTGQVLKHLPDGADTILINGVQYFRFNGQYFMPTERNGDRVFVVVQL